MRAPVGSDTDRSLPQSGQDSILLSTLESSRDLIARRLVHEYHTVTDPDLNYCAVTSLLQIIFLRTGQECGFVEPGTLAALAGCDGIQKRMARACSDTGLNPELFFECGPEGSRTVPARPDEPLREIIRRLDQPDVPVPGSRLAVEELAAVLDRFLGTRMETAEGCRVNRVGKSTLLYTGSVDVPPRDVVEYLVREAVGGISDRSQNRGKRLRVLDPACGSGFFLLAAYRYLVRKNTRHLVRPEEIQIVLKDLADSSLFGTDIDPESVSAARLILLFAYIEESQCSGAGVVSPGQVREVCSYLVKTIRCGNSLIAPDYFSGKPVFPFNADERRRVNPFDWTETFPEIIAEGGFDAVIGAPPPYRPFAIKAREEYFQTHYDAYAQSAGLYGYFIERGLSLSKPGGIISVLVPGTFLRSQYGKSLRRLLLSRQIETITNTGRTRMLPEGTAPVYILMLRNQLPERPFVVSPVWKKDGARQGSAAQDFSLDQRSFDDGGWRLEDTRTAKILEKILAAGTPLEEYAMGEIAPGTCRTRNNPLVVDYTTKNQLTKNAWWCRHFFVPLLRPADIRRYVPARPEKFVLVIDDLRKLRKCRALAEFLEQSAKDPASESGVRGREDDPASGAENFSGFAEPEKNRPKIIFSPFQQSPAFCIDPDGTYAIAHSLLAIPRNDPFLLAILNSGLGRFVLTRTCPLTDRGYHVSSTVLGKFPVYIPDFDKLADRNRHDRMVSLVTHILELNRYLPQAKTDQERRLIRQDIDATDVRIDALVYEIYGLTLEEITVVEESAMR